MKQRELEKRLNSIAKEVGGICRDVADIENRHGPIGSQAWATSVVDCVLKKTRDKIDALTEKVKLLDAQPQAPGRPVGAVAKTLNGPGLDQDNNPIAKASETLNALVKAAKDAGASAALVKAIRLGAAAAITPYRLN